MNLVPRQARQAGQYHRTSFETLIKPPGRVLMLHRCLVVFYVLGFRWCSSLHNNCRAHNEGEQGVTFSDDRTYCIFEIHIQLKKLNFY